MFTSEIVGRAGIHAARTWGRPGHRDPPWSPATAASSSPAPRASNTRTSTATQVTSVLFDRPRDREHRQWLEAMQAVPEVPIEIARFGFMEWARGAAVIALQQLLESAIGPT